MESQTLPLPLIRAALRAMPPAALARVTDVLVRRMRRRHPRLFKNLARLEPAGAVVQLIPTDVPHKFVMTLGRDPVTFEVMQNAEQKRQTGQGNVTTAQISGSLGSLLAMLEGRVDGDTLFFSRDIEVSGDTALIVGLRNTLDREEINIFDEVTSLCGPFAQPARIALTLAHDLARRVRDRRAA